MQKHQRLSGFTLLELSIVLMIIGVLVAGILIGRTMVATSRLQTVITDAGNIISAVNNFKSAYLALPGDFSDATTQWGTDSSGCPSGGGASGTCNGDSNGKIGSNCSSGSMSVTNSGESYRAWQHLASSTLYNSNLTGVTASGTSVTRISSNIPASPIEGGGYMLMWLDDPSTCSNHYGLLTSGGNHGNALVLVNNFTQTSAPATTITTAITPEQAYQIDSKMDDSVPGTGNVRSFGAKTSGCTTTNVASTAAYALTTTTVKCAPIFLMGN